MHLKLPVVLLGALALVAPSAIVDAKDKARDKGKNKDKHEQTDDRRGGRSNDDHRDHDGDRDGDKITICHIPPGNRSARHTITVGEAAWGAHQGHGDYRGACRRANQGGRFDEIDTNNDGVISIGEWVGDRGTFDRLDSNNDGVISRREFSRT